MTKPYLPNRATIQESCLWLEAETGEHWTLPRLLECGMQPHFWLDFSPGYPAIFGSRTEGYLAPMIFQGDIDRLSTERSDVVLVTWTLAHDGTPIKALEPHAWPVSIDDLRFLRKDIMRLSEHSSKAACSGTPEKAAPLNNAQAKLSKIVDALELYAKEAKTHFDRQAMPGPLGENWQEEGSFHWLCARIDPTFKRARDTFKKHRAGICALEQYAQPTDFYRLALPRMAPILDAMEKAHKGEKT